MKHATTLFALAICAAGAPAQQFSELGRSPLGVTSDWAYCVATGDVNGDGADDIVFYETFTGLQLHVSDGRGRFALRTLPWAGQATELDLVDLDADGDRDLVVGVGFSAVTRNRFLLNDGAGNFAPPIFLSVGGNDTRATLVEDFDGDGDPDLLFFNRYGALYSEMYLNDGSASFVGAHANVPNFAGERAWSAAAGDVDGDGDLDVVVGNGESSANMRLLVNNGSGVFTDASGRLPSRLADTMAVELVDIDGDSDLDIVAASGEASFTGSPPLQTRAYVNDGQGNFTDETGSRMPVDGDKTVSMAVADFDEDGDFDLWIGNDGVARFYVNDGTGVYTDERLRIPVDADRSSNVAAGDFDADGDLDIVSTSFQPDPNRIYFNLLRHIDVQPALTVGQESIIDLWAYPTVPGMQHGLVLLSAGTAWIPLGSLGTLGIDPVTMVELRQLTLLFPFNRATLPIRVPNNPAFRGLTVGLQAVVLNASSQLHLTNAYAEAIR